MTFNFQLTVHLKNWKRATFLKWLGLDNLEKISIEDVYNEHIIKITKLLVHTLKIDSLKSALLTTFVQNCPFLEILMIYHDSDDDLSNISDELKRL
ncbi:1851_t:CDS:2, partial [Funneliformis caledonium]